MGYDCNELRLKSIKINSEDDDYFYVDIYFDGVESKEDLNFYVSFDASEKVVLVQTDWEVKFKAGGNSSKNKESGCNLFKGIRIEELTENLARFVYALDTGEEIEMQIIYSDTWNKTGEVVFLAGDWSIQVKRQPTEEELEKEREWKERYEMYGVR